MMIRRGLPVVGSSPAGGKAPRTVRAPPAEAQLLCNYAAHLCGREKLAGHDFCLRHILDDRNATFKPCNYQYRQHRRCPRPAPKSDRKDGYCIEHSRRALMTRQKTSRKRSLVHSARCLEDLSHYKPTPRPVVRTAPPDGVAVVKEEPGTTPSNVIKNGVPADENDELKNEEAALDFLTRRIPSVNQRAFDGSEMDSDDDPTTVESSYFGGDDSDAESVDSEMDNPLKHSGAYSAEEVIRIMRDKLIRLQKLYIDQFQRLRYLLREEKRRYKRSLLREKEAELSSIHKQVKETMDELAAYEKVKALAHYHQPQGLEAVLQSQFMERRQRLGDKGGTSASASTVVPPSVVPATKIIVFPKCSYHITSSTKCGDPVIPSSKFCIKHILEDPNQVLFRTCGFNPSTKQEDEMDSSNADGPCETPIADVLESATCVYHNQFAPPYSAFDDKANAELKSEHLQSQDLEQTPKLEGDCIKLEDRRHQLLT